MVTWWKILASTNVQHRWRRLIAAAPKYTKMAVLCESVSGRATRNRSQPEGWSSCPVWNPFCSVISQNWPYCFVPKHHKSLNRTSATWSVHQGKTWGAARHLGLNIGVTATLAPFIRRFRHFHLSRHLPGVKHSSASNRDLVFIASANS